MKNELKIIIRHISIMLSIYILLALIIYVPFFLEHGYQKGVDLFWAEAGIGLVFSVPIATLYVYVLTWILAKYHARPLIFIVAIFSVILGSISMFLSLFNLFPLDLLFATIVISIGNIVYYKFL